MEIQAKHKVPLTAIRARLSDYAVKAFADFIPSRKGIKKAIKKGRILIDNEVGFTGDYIVPGHILSLLYDDANPPKVYEHSLDILYEDDYLAVIYKPAGLLVSGNSFRTVFNALPHNLTISILPDALVFPTPVHRLDKGTSGCLLIAKCRSAQGRLGDAFRERTILKSYKAIVQGSTEEKGSIELEIEGKSAYSQFTKIKTVPSLKYGAISLLSLYPKTGRRHQLRIHMESIGHPIIGDREYGDQEVVYRGKGIFLSATGLAFTHPFTGAKLDVEVPTPYKFEAFMKRETRRF